MLSYILFSLILMNPLKVGGIALALSLSQLLNFLALFFYLEKKIAQIEKRELILSALKSFLAAALMGVLVWLFMEQLDFSRLVFLKQAGVLFSAIFLGILIYVLSSLLFNQEDLRDLRRIFSQEKILREESRK
jgi:putative peptidoglycan lipid II flippase